MGCWKALSTVMVVAAALASCCPRDVRGEEADTVRESVVDFLRALAGGDERVVQELRWNASVAPCGDDSAPRWLHVNCTVDGRIKKIALEGRLDLNGTINATLLCAAGALQQLSVKDNALRGALPADISTCSKLASLYVSGNHLSGTLPPSLGELRELSVLDVSRNDFSGELPVGLSKVGLTRFLANDNHFNGTIPEFDLTNFDEFDVSNNNLTGPIPRDTGKFGSGSFSGNAAGMCGQPLFAPCPPSSGHNEGKRTSEHSIVMYLGYFLLVAGIVAFVLYVLCSTKKSHKLGRKPKGGAGGKSAYESSNPTTASATPSKSAYSLPMSEERSATTAAAAARAPSASLVVLRRSGTAAATPKSAAAMAAKDLRFEDLLKSPAELLGRGRFGSAYKVVAPGGAALAVKRVKDAAASAVPEEEFRRRMGRVGKARHPAVLPPLAFYCAMQEKLVVYEFQSNGSLAKLLHGSVESSQVALGWPGRLHVAAKVADGVAFMHDALRGGDGANANLSFSYSSEEDEASAFGDGAIAHGNLKASNILFTASMEPCISEYGVTAPPLPPSSAPSDAAALRADVRAYGVLLLELLTGKAAADGAELARWVTSVIREEWTAEVFDRAMLSAGASEQRMVRLLQVAMRCIDASSLPPTMAEVAGMVNAIRDEDDRSLSSEA